MILDWHKSMSNSYPKLLDVTSSEDVVYLRKNVEEKTVIDDISDENYTIYEYDEVILSKEEYELYLKEIEIPSIQKLRADIDYLYLMSDIDLEENGGI